MKKSKNLKKKFSKSYWREEWGVGGMGERMGGGGDGGG